jgi:sugar phosphate isomerase/epimerase
LGWQRKNEMELCKAYHVEVCGLSCIGDCDDPVTVRTKKRKEERERMRCKKVNEFSELAREEVEERAALR